jgi:hypothetical protein
MALRSQEFGTTWVTGNASVTDNQTVSPDGATTADLLVDNATSNIHRLRQTITLSGSTTYTLSVFAKKNTLSNFQLALISTTDSSTASAVFNLDNGTVGESIVLTATLASTSIQNVGNGWYRCSITGSMATTPNTAQITLATLSTGNATNAGQVTYSGDGTGSIFIWQAQLETGSVATSPIVTTASTASRVADVVTLTGASSLIGQPSGSMFCEFEFRNTGALTRVFGLSTGATDINNSFRLNKGATGTLSYAGTTASVSQFTITSGGTYVGQIVKVGVAYATDDVAFYAQGVQIGTDATSTTPAFNTVTLGVNEDAGVFLNGWIRSVALFPTRLSNAQLETLTT